MLWISVRQKRTIQKRDWEKGTTVFRLSTGEPAAVGHAAIYYSEFQISQKTNEVSEDREI